MAGFLHPLANSKFQTGKGGFFYKRGLYLAVLLLFSIMLVACGSKPKHTAAPTAQGQYRVVKGDTLTKIARMHGQTVQSLMQMNSLKNPNQIRVGQVLRVQGNSRLPDAGSTTALGPEPVTGKSVAAPRAIKLVWPADGPTQRGTSENNSQGVYISAPAGASVTAAADGSVVYAGNGLRGYGNMLIISHDTNFLSVYAHNERLLVSEGAKVSQGQKIATVGSSDSDKVNLYFELRYDGRPVDALRYLPAKP